MLIVGIFSHVYFQSFDSSDYYTNWKNCTTAAEAISNFYNSNQPIVQDFVLATCVKK